MVKQRVILDFETRSPVDLIACGRVVYAKHPDTDILMMGYRILNEEEKVIDEGLWLPEEMVPGQRLPDFCIHPDAYELFAFNAQFEYAIWNDVGVRRYGFRPTELENWHDIMALCGRFGLPQNLADAAKALNLSEQKDTQGKILIKLFCTPPYGRDANGSILPQHCLSWKAFQEYCMQDVATEHELLKQLPSDKLSQKERKIWIHNCVRNLRGVPIDVENIPIIRRAAEVYREGQYELLPGLTDGKITKITQTVRIKKFLNENGIDVEDVRAETVQQLLERDDLPENITMLLEMRATLGMSSIGKYIRMENMNYKGRVYDSERYYGAHTGRCTGSGVQFLNLPRAKVENPEKEIGLFRSGDIFKYNPVLSARALIRPMVYTKENVFHAADFASIEYVVLEWFAGDTKKLEDFRNGLDPYIDQAAYLYGVKYDTIGEKSKERFFGKVIILGCGYGMGRDKFQSTAKNSYKLDLTSAEAELAVNSYRENHALVKKLWYTFSAAMISAIQNKGVPVEVKRCKFQVVKDRNKREWLSLTLPSGRNLFYLKPHLEDGQYGPMPCHWGLEQKTKTWRPLSLIPGRITENIVQATSRDILMHGMLCAEDAGFPIVLSVYDEAITETTRSSHEDYLAFCKALSTTEEWAKDIPVMASGYTSNRYRKD